MSRLDSERQARLEHPRMETAIFELGRRGYAIQRHAEQNALLFEHAGRIVTFWPYSGWHSGATIKDGRGLQKLLDQLPPPIPMAIEP
jgi:hypothetical protein